ncbi:hypothetical protein A0H81_07004 [Grifola frondosa]|uniref:Uncharacterized protein n=1 Tax=Grifola frondosa TaxID=5627 RepID=A0A1C7M7E4_GRIFR|nr:hypothetical protein A0H81_07004 [Grifola frondosa]
MQKKKYKSVALKVQPVLATLPNRFRIVRNIQGDPLADMPSLDPNPPSFVPTGRYTQARRDAFRKAHNTGFLWPAELDLIDDFMCKQHEGFAWDDMERGRFRQDFFPPVEIPVIEHKPWVQRNIPIPPGIFDEVCRIIRKKIEAGVYEPSNSSYRSRWFCILKKDGKALRLVHSLEPLNAVTIQHSGVPPIPEHIAEKFGNRACGGMLDLYVGYDEREIAESSRDLTSFQTPYGALRLVTLPMGWTNAVPIFHDNVTYILQPEIPHITISYIDDVPVRGPETRYELPEGGYEVIATNPGIRRFVWEHMHSINRIVQRMRYSGGTFSGTKSLLVAEETLIIGHRCTYKGRLPEESRVKAIENWGPCKDLSEVRAFLDTIGVVHIFIHNFAQCAHPLVYLMRKDIPFEFEVDARYIKGMLQNPDIAPSASINRWIVAILTFYFTLVHVPGTNHGPDGLSRRPRQPDDEDEPEDDFEDWIDRIHGFAHIVNPHPTQKVTRDSLTSMYALEKLQPDLRQSSQKEKENHRTHPKIPTISYLEVFKPSLSTKDFYSFATGIGHSSDQHNSQMQTTRLLLSSQYNSSSTPLQGALYP